MTGAVKILGATFEVEYNNSNKKKQHVRYISRDEHHTTRWLKNVKPTPAHKECINKYLTNGVYDGQYKMNVCILIYEYMCLLGDYVYIRNGGV